MAGFTTRLGLKKPGGGSTGAITPDEIVDIDDINGNFDLIDSAVGAKLVTSTTRPSTPFDGQIIRESDTKNLLAWSATSSSWLFLAGGDSGWIKPAVLAGFTTTTDAQQFAYRAIGGICYFTGLLNKTAWTGTNIVFVFPTGFRPTSFHYFKGNYAGGYAEANVDTSGNLTFTNPSSGINGLAVSGSFPIG
jgi:hypothetical protein